MSQELTQLRATSAATFGRVQAYIKGLRGVFSLLTTQHREIRSLLRSASSARGEEQRQLWMDARGKLLAHERAELSVVYTLIESFANTEQLTQRHVHDVDELLVAIAELDAAALDRQNLCAKLLDLIAIVQQHVGAEEGEYFWRAQESIGREGYEGLIEPFQQAYRQELEKLAVEPDRELASHDLSTRSAA